MNAILDKKHIKIALWVLLLVSFITLFLPYLTIDWEDFDVLGILSIADVEDSNLTPINCFIQLFDSDIAVVDSIFSDDVDGIFCRFFVAVLAAYIILLVNMILFLKRNWNKIVFTILHSISFLCFQNYHLVLYQIKRAMKQSLNEEMGIFGDIFGDFTNNVFSKAMNLFKDALGIGYWIFTIAGALIFVVLIVDTNKVRSLIGGNTTSEKWNFMPKSQLPIPNPSSLIGLPAKNGVLKVLSGKYTGADINIQNGERIIIGRNPKRCHLILENPNVSGEHCEIRYVQAENMFYVLDKSLNGTYRVSQTDRSIVPLKKGIEERLPVGTVIMIGKEGDQIQLRN